MKTKRGYINRIMDCPRCGPKFEKQYKKFLKEIKRLIANEEKAVGK